MCSIVLSRRPDTQVYNAACDLGKTIWLLSVIQDEMNIDAQRAVVKLNVEIFEKGKSYANVAINITFKIEMKVFKDNLIDID